LARCKKEKKSWSILPGTSRNSTEGISGRSEQRRNELTLGERRYVVRAQQGPPENIEQIMEGQKKHRQRGRQQEKKGEATKGKVGRKMNQQKREVKNPHIHKIVVQRAPEQRYHAEHIYQRSPRVATKEGGGSFPVESKNRHTQKKKTQVTL